MIKIIPPTVYVPTDEQFIDMGFEARLIEESYGWWEFYNQNPWYFVRYYMEKKCWEISGVAFYPTSEKELKTVMKCLISPSIQIQ